MIEQRRAPNGRIHYVTPSPSDDQYLSNVVYSLCGKRTSGSWSKIDHATDDSTRRLGDVCHVCWNAHRKTTPAAERSATPEEINRDFNARAQRKRYIQTFIDAGRQPPLHVVVADNLSEARL